MRHAPAPLALLGLLLMAGPSLAFVPVEGTAAASRWQTTASGSTGQAGEAATLTWSFVPDGTLVARPENQNNQDPSDLIAEFDAAFGSGTGGSDLTQRPWFTYFEQAFDRWSDLSGVTYVYEPNDNSSVDHGSGFGSLGARGDVRIGGISMDGIGGTLAYNYFPQFGDMALDTDDLADLFTDDTGNYSGLRNTIMHEAGHGLGLEHVSSGDADFLMAPAINRSFDGPQHDDLRGIHWLYGDRYEKAAAGPNDTAANATSLGNLLSGSTLAIGTSGDGTSIGANEVDFVSISNENDDDYFAFTITQGLEIDLTMTPRGANYLQGTQPFVTTETANLSLALFDSNGVSLLSESASGGAGVIESINNFVLDTPGTYFARVASASAASNQVVQFYELELSAAALDLALPGDANGDGSVDLLDLDILGANFGEANATFAQGDFNDDGTVDLLDLDLLGANFGATSGTTAIPEPTALGLLLAGLMAVRSKR